MIDRRRHARPMRSAWQEGDGIESRARRGVIGHDGEVAARQGRTMAEWALILGASSGFGEATSLALATIGFNIFGVHLDRRATLPNAHRIVRDIEAKGRRAEFFNLNAAEGTNRKDVLDRAEQVLQEEGSGQVRVMLHSLAFGTLRPFLAEKPEESITKAQIDMTLDVMAHSLVYWVQDLVWRKLMGRGGRIYAMTSAGSTRIFPTYGAVSAAKAALESHMRQLAYELAPHGITINAIRAGVTDTPASRQIPGYENMAAIAASRNPMGRMTRPADVAAAIAALCQEGTHWITGTVIGVDGGEDIVA
jgi:enoyl-[acyl-carrier protein] reductase III